jgi:hypothetical protein
MWSGTLQTREVGVAAEIVAIALTVVGINEAVVAAAEISTIEAVVAKIGVDQGRKVAKVRGRGKAKANAVPPVVDLVRNPAAPAALVALEHLAVRAIGLLVIVARVPQGIARRAIVLQVTAPKATVRRVAKARPVVIVAHVQIVVKAEPPVEIAPLEIVARVVRVAMTVGIGVMIVSKMTVPVCPKAGTPAFNRNHAQWKRWRSKSKPPAALTPFSMSPNYSFLHGIGIWCISSIKTKHPPHAIPRPLLKAPRLRPLPTHRQNSCNAHWITRSG